MQISEFRFPIANLWSPKEKTDAFERSNAVAEDFEGGQNRNGKQRAWHAPKIAPKQKCQQNRDRVKD